MCIETFGIKHVIFIMIVCSCPVFMVSNFKSTNWELIDRNNVIILFYTTFSIYAMLTLKHSFFSLIFK